MLIANADDRMPGCVTLASAALAGPVLKNRQNSVTKIKTPSGRERCYEHQQEQWRADQHANPGH